MIWTKLQFDVQHRDEELRWIIRALDGMKDMNMDLIRKNGRGDPDFPTHEAVEIASDYLRRVRKWIFISMERQFGPGYIDNLATEVVVTIPAVSTTKPSASAHTGYRPRRRR